MIIGVDIGNYSVKTSELISFISKFSEYPSFTEENKIVIDGKVYYISEGEFSTEWDKSKKDNTIPLLYTALAQNDANYFKVVLGLPIGQYKKNKELLKNKIKENSFKHVVFGNKEKDILITDILIAPEGASAYYNLTLEQKEMIGRKQLLIVDIGGRSTDICLLQNNKIIDVKTIAIGMLNVYQEIIDNVNQIYTQEFKLEDGEEILKDGLFLDGEYKDKSFIKPILIKNFNSIYKDLQLHFNPNKGYVLLTGGGSMIFKNAFENRLKNIIVDSNPIFSNAMGFYKLGLNIWRD